MAVEIIPNGSTNTHLFSLSDDTQEIGLIGVTQSMERDATLTGRTPVDQSSLKTSSGNQTYDDQKPPYMKQVPIDWSGGRGAKEWESDTTKYKDALRANTERTGKIIMGGRETYSNLGVIRTGMQSLPGSMKLVALLDQKKTLAIRITANATFNALEIWAWLRAIGKPGDLNMDVMSDNAGAMNAVLQTITYPYEDLVDRVSELSIFSLSSEAIATAAAYWLRFYGNADNDDKNCWEIGCKQQVGTTYQDDSLQSTAVAISDVDIYYRLLADITDQSGFLFQYKKALYFLTKPASGAPHLYINGVRGVTISNSGELSKLKASGSPNWTTNELAGGVAWVIEGTGSTEEQNFRNIVSNGANYVDVDEPWLIVHDTTTVFVCVGLNKWTEITGHGMTTPPTDVLIDTSGYLRICLGFAVNMKMMREYNNAGTWTRDFNDDGTNKADFLKEYNNPTSAVRNLVRSRAGLISSVATPAWTTPAAWPTTTFGTEQSAGATWEKVNGLQPYVDSSQDNAMWILKEGVPWLLSNATLEDAKLPELATIASYKNGLASCQLGSYLYLSIQNSVHRFFHPTLEDIGPTLGQGLPVNRRGHCVALVGYPGRVFAAYDAGPNNYSSVLAHTGGQAWHEIYRAPLGKRIRALNFQVIPGENPDRLWILQGGELLWIPYPSDEFDPEHDDNYPYTHELVVEQAPMFAGLKDAYKFYKQVKIEAANLSAGTCWVEMDYKMDDGDTWIPLPELFEISPFSESLFDEKFGANGRKLETRIRAYTTNQYITPRITAIIISGVTVVEPKFTYMTPVHLDAKNLRGELDDLTPQKKLEVLDAWTGRARPLRMKHSNPLYNDKLVFLMPIPNRPKDTPPQDGNKYTYTVTIIVQEA